MHLAKLVAVKADKSNNLDGIFALIATERNGGKRIMSDIQELPRLSPSIAKTLIERSPLHAFQQHRLLGGGNLDDSSAAKDRGNIFEAIVFGVDSDRFIIIDADSYRSKEAQSARDLARNSNRIPILIKDWAEYETIGNAIKKSINDQGIYFSGGEYQRTFEWDDDGVMCKGITDYYQPGIIFDLKTTSDASPKKVQRLFTDFGWDIAYAAYVEGVEKNYPELAGRVKILFIVCEIEAPFCVQFYEPSGMMRDLGSNKWHWAKETWRACLESGVWPGYFQGVGRVDPTPWAMNFAQAIETSEGGN